MLNNPAPYGARLADHGAFSDNFIAFLLVVIHPLASFAGEADRLVEILFPPHGRSQILVYSVTPRGYNHPYEGTTIPPATAADKAASGLYFSRLLYDRDVQPTWRFE